MEGNFRIEIKETLKKLGKSIADLSRSPHCKDVTNYGMIKGYLNNYHGINGEAFLAIAQQLKEWKEAADAETKAEG
jgi:hypothetical protein